MLQGVETVPERISVYYLSLLLSSCCGAIAIGASLIVDFLGVLH